MIGRARSIPARFFHLKNFDIISKGGKNMEEMLANIAQSGFSVAVAAYLLIRMEKRLEALTEAIRELRDWIRIPE